MNAIRAWLAEWRWYEATFAVLWAAATVALFVLSVRAMMIGFAAEDRHVGSLMPGGACLPEQSPMIDSVGAGWVCLHGQWVRLPDDESQP